MSTIKQPGRQHSDALQTARPDIRPPKKYAVYLLNDDYTTMDFVVEVLSEIFALPHERAVAVMMLVHHEGKGLCGVYTRDMAETKQHQVHSRAKEQGHPLMCTVEEV